MTRREDPADDTDRAGDPLGQAVVALGAKWSLLILAELAFGGRRFSELRDALPGLSGNILSERLRALADHGLVTRRADGSSAGRIYELTGAGGDVRPVLVELASWALRTSGRRSLNGATPAQAMLALLAVNTGRPPPAGVWTILFRLDAQPFAVSAEGRLLLVERGSRERPSARLSGSVAALAVSPDEMCAGPEIIINGDRSLVEALLELRDQPLAPDPSDIFAAPEGEAIPCTTS